jgi:hypothetical protein
MNIYLWIGIILIADVLLVLFVRSADDRRQQKRETEWRRV